MVQSYWTLHIVNGGCAIQVNFLSYTPVLVRIEVPQAISKAFNSKGATKLFMIVYFGNQYPWSEGWRVREPRNKDIVKYLWK